MNGMFLYVNGKKWQKMTPFFSKKYIEKTIISMPVFIKNRQFYPVNGGLVH